MFINRFLLLLVGLMVFGLVAACSPGVSKVSDAPKPFLGAMQAPTRARTPIAVLKAYYSAIKMRETDAAQLYLASDIVLVKTKPAPCPFDVVKGQQAVQEVLDSPSILSFVVDNVRVDGDKVTYAVTEWLDPRIVGPNYPQPVKSQLVAVLQYGAIVAITETRAPEWVARRTQVSQDAPCW